MSDVTSESVAVGDTPAVGGAARRTKVVVVGGGPSGLSAAYHLTSAANPRAAELDVAVYQMGWRLGGKGATGRDPENDRILEHGIHGFAGFYWNSTEMLKGAYEVLNPGAVPNLSELPGRLPRCIEEALIPSDAIVLTNYYTGRQCQRTLVLAPGDGPHPWERAPDMGAQDVVKAIAQYAMALVQALIESGEKKGWFARLLLWGPERIERKLVGELAAVLGHAKAGRHEHLLKGFDALLGWLVNHALRPSDKWDTARLAFNVIDYYRTIIKGLIAEGLLDIEKVSGGPGVSFTVKGIDSVDHLNYTDWLHQHGLHPMTMASSFTHSTAYVCFSLPGGDSSQVPTMSAASFLLWELRTAFSRRNHFYWFRLGTGETIIKPVYQALQANGVRFEFFHKLIDVELATDGSTVESLTFQRQARVKGDAAYQPLRPAKRAEVGEVWPDEPLWDQLENADEILAHLRHDPHLGMPTLGLESAWCAWQPDDQVVLRRGVDFDIAVVAMPPAAIEHFARSLADHPRIRPAVDKLESVQTMQLHLWFNKSVEQMGLHVPQSPGAVNRYTTVSLPDPLNALVDFTDTMAYEGWTEADRPQTLVQLCGPLQNLGLRDSDYLNPDYPEQIWRRAAVVAGQWMRTAGVALPQARGDRTMNQLSFDFQSLWHDGDEHKGEQRLWSQYIRANIDPSELYVLSPKGSASARPQPWDVLDNLAVAGDWVYTGINIGSFEGATMGGKLASYAVSGYPTMEQIPGYSLLHGTHAPVNTGLPLMDRAQADGRSTMAPD